MYNLLGRINDFKFAGMLEQDVLYHSCEFKTSLPFLKRFYKLLAAYKTRGANYAGFHSDNHKYAMASDSEVVAR